VECLSEGKQPDLDLLSKVGYLYRTTAVYGSGKFGLADRFRIKNREEINGPFRLEMMLVYLVRQFTFDQVNHVAHYKNPKKAVKLNEQICKNLGIGNSTGLGMAPFIVNHPTLLNNWILSREKALKKIREIRVVDYYDSELFMDCVKKSLKNITTWNTESEYQKNKIKSLLKDVQKFIKFIENDFDFKTEYPFNEIYLWLEKNTCDECIEYIVSIMMEPYDNITKPLVANMSSDEDKYFNIPTDRTIQELKLIIQSRYPNILDINFDKKENNENFWFISKNKEEPRLANRFEEHGSELEQPLAIARDIKKLYQKLLSEKNDITIAQFLSKNSELRHVVRRAFIIEKFPYAEIQDNTIGKNIIPIDMLRLKLSFFGALKFDPRSDKWLRICMFQGAPLPSELKTYDEQWVYKANS
jgi:3-dehydroquinate dehydratase